MTPRLINLRLNIWLFDSLSSATSYLRRDSSNFNRAISVLFARTSLSFLNYFLERDLYSSNEKVLGPILFKLELLISISIYLIFYKLLLEPYENLNTMLGLVKINKLT